jgi:hypothetical protein
MIRVHVFFRCYVDHQTAPARAALVPAARLHVAFPYVAPLIHLRIMSTIRGRTAILAMPQWRYRESVVAGVGLDSRPEASVVDAWVVRTQTRQADCPKGIHLPGAPRGTGSLSPREAFGGSVLRILGPRS